MMSLSSLTLRRERRADLLAALDRGDRSLELFRLWRVERALRAVSVLWTKPPVDLESDFRIETEEVAA